MILKRQKALLCMLDAAGGRASRLQCVKWSFLVRNESRGGGGDTFYRFLPYLKGPFSFCLYHEAAKLVRGGFMAEPDDDLWELTPAGRDACRSLPDSVRADVLDVLSLRGRQPVAEMVEYVYATYPWYTLNSEAGSRVERPVAGHGVYTAGYEGRSVDSFLDGLLRAGVGRVIDVRRNPVARRYGFHGSTLRRLCGKLGLEYRHFPELGIRREERARLTSQADYDALFARYERATLASEGGAVQEVALLVAERPSVLVCMEADPARCHRTRLARAVSRDTGLPVKHLGDVA